MASHWDALPARPSRKPYIDGIDTIDDIDLIDDINQIDKTSDRQNIRSTKHQIDGSNI